MKKNLIKRIVALAFGFTFAVGAFGGCAELFQPASQSESNSSIIDSSSNSAPDSSVNQPVEEYTPEKLISNGEDLSDYNIVISSSASEAVKYAAEIFQSNINKAAKVKIPIVTDATSEGEHEIIIGKTSRKECAALDYDALGLESFKIRSVDKDLVIAGNERGAIYGVYEYLESLGFRYYTPEVSRIPRKSLVYIAKDVEIDWEPIFTYREPMFECANDFSADPVATTEWAVSQRINSSFIRSGLRTDKKYGGSTGWIGGDQYMVHTVGKYLPYSTYGQDHPDWFSENGANPCFTNEDAMAQLYLNVLQMVDSDSSADIVDISMNDTGEYCKCDTCLEAYEEYGVSETYYRAINDMAKKLKVDRPNRAGLKVNTISYAFALEPPQELVLEDNMIITLCLSMCRFHTDPEECHEMGMLYSDATTDVRSLKTEQQRLLGWDGHASNIRVYYYAINWAMMYTAEPSYEAMRENFRFFADNNVMGIYNEAYPKKSGEFAELKAYLTAKLMSDPYMSKEEYYYHMDDFLQGYYGDGWDFIREYIDTTYEMILAEMPRSGHLPYWYPVDENFQFDYDPKTKQFASFVEEFDELWDEAEAYANPEQLERVQKSRVHWDYINLYNTWDRRYENASNEERKEMVAKNKSLYERIVKFGLVMRYDTDGVISSVTDFSLSPALWWR